MKLIFRNLTLIRKCENFSQQNKSRKRYFSRTIMTWHYLKTSVCYINAVENNFFHEINRYSFFAKCSLYVVCRAVWFHLYNSKNVKNTHEECDQAFYKSIFNNNVHLFLHRFNLFWLWWSDRQNWWCQYYFSLVDNFLQIYWYDWYLKLWLEIDSRMVFLIPKCNMCNVTDENMGTCADFSKFRTKTE